MSSNNKMELDNNQQAMKKVEEKIFGVEVELKGMTDKITKISDILVDLTVRILSEKDEKQQKVLIEQQLKLEIRELELKIKKAKLEHDDMLLEQLNTQLTVD